VLDVTLPTSGAYRIFVSDSGGTHTGGYNIGLLRLNPPANATPIGFGETILATMRREVRRDVQYEFAALRNKRIDFSPRARRNDSHVRCYLRVVRIKSGNKRFGHSNRPQC